MRSRKYKITRRNFIAGPAALAASVAAIQRPAHALGPFAANADVSKVALLSARHCAHHGFVDIKGLARPFEADLLAGDPSLLRDVLCARPTSLVKSLLTLEISRNWI